MCSSISPSSLSLPSNVPLLFHRRFNFSFYANPYLVRPRNSRTFSVATSIAENFSSVELSWVSWDNNTPDEFNGWAIREAVPKTIKENNTDLIFELFMSPDVDGKFWQFEADYEMCFWRFDYSVGNWHWSFSDCIAWFYYLFFTLKKRLCFSPENVILIYCDLRCWFGFLTLRNFYITGIELLVYFSFWLGQVLGFNSEVHLMVYMGFL